MATKSFTVKTKLPPNPFVHEIFELVSKQRSKAKKVEVLKEQRCDALTALLIWNFDDSIISLLPEGEVPYEKNEVPVGTDHTSLRKEWKNLYHFVKGGNDSLSKTRRESMFIQILEGLHLPDNNLPSPVNLLSLLVKVSLPAGFFCLLQAFSWVVKDPS